MRVRRLAVLPAALVVMAAASGAARADTTWTRISTNFDENTVVPSLALDGANAVAAWGYSVGPNNERAEAVTFRPALNGDAVSLAGPTAAAANWVGVDKTPQLFPRPDGGLQLAWAGFRSTSPGEQFDGKLIVAQRNSDGSFGPPAVAGRPYTSLSSAIALSDGTPMFAMGHAGGALVLRSINPNQDGANYQGALGGCCGYTPRLGLDGMGRLWLVWYSNASGNTGLYVQQVNPATGGQMGSPQKAPASESVYNNSLRIAFACAVACRVVYGTGGSPGRLVSWAAGESQATLVTTALGTDSAGRVVTASYRADGRLWVAWSDRTNYRFTLGNDKGAGGEALNAGHPPGDPGAFALNSLPVPDGLLLAANWASGGRHAIWANVVTVPPPATPAPGPRDVELGYDPKRKRFLINVQYVLRTACRNPCPARAELRTRTGRRLYAVGALPGDGKHVLGRRQGIKIPRGRKIFFYIPIKRAALLRVPFKTIRGYRYGETRLRVWLRTPSGEALTVRDGRIRVSIARIKSGALPNLKGIL